MISPFVRPNSQLPVNLHVFKVPESWNPLQPSPAQLSWTQPHYWQWIPLPCLSAIRPIVSLDLFSAILFSVNSLHSHLMGLWWSLMILFVQGSGICFRIQLFFSLGFCWCFTALKHEFEGWCCLGREYWRLIVIR